VFTCGQLRRIDPQALLSRFGKTGLWMAQVSRGEDCAEVGYWQEEASLPQSISHSHTMEKEILHRQELEAWIRMLSEMVASRLRKEKLESRVSSLYLREREAVFSREKNFQFPTADPARIYERNLWILKSFQLKIISVRALGVCASSLTPAQELYLFPVDRKRGRLLAAMDKINQLQGEWAIYPAAIGQVKN
jgi:nucleotidyltransferase/DNA polymerase involved in DNA repair